MTKISELSREIALEVQALTNRPLAIDDYLRIRKQSEEEILNGLYDSKVEEIIASPILTAKQNVSKEETKIIAAKKEAPIKQSGSSVDFTEKPDDTDPFFALCNKL